MATTEETIGELVDPASPEAIAEAAAGVRIAERVGLTSARAFARVGQTLTLTDTATAATFPLVGVVRTLLYAEERTLFTETDTAAWRRPLLKVQVAGDWRSVGDGPFVGDTVAVPDGSGGIGDTIAYEVRKVDRTYIADTVHRTILYLAVDL